MVFIIPFIYRPLGCTRPLHTHELKKKTAQELVDKFIQQAKQIPAGSRLIRMDTLPSTATTQDILKLARESFLNGDKSVLDMVFCRKKTSFKMTGKCMVLMTSTEDARRFILYGHQRFLGGNRIRMSFGDLTQDPENYLKTYRHVGLKTENQSAGRSVLVSGFPSKIARHLANHLGRKNFFPADGVPDNVVRLRGKPSSEYFKYMIKFDTESEAWRCVRAFHNTPYTVHKTKKTSIIQVNVVY